MAEQERLYRWKPGSRCTGVDPQKAGKRLSKIEAEYGVVQTDLVIDDARKKSAPYHDYFEWNDKTAAHEHRRAQARHLIASLWVVPNEEANVREEGTPMYANIVQDDEDEEGTTLRGYVSTLRVASDPELHQQVLAQAIRDIEALQRKYQHLQELKPFWRALGLLKKALAARKAA
jgi:hypothetical protein